MSRILAEAMNRRRVRCERVKDQVSCRLKGEDAVSERPEARSLREASHRISICLPGQVPAQVPVNRLRTAGGQ